LTKAAAIATTISAPAMTAKPIPATITARGEIQQIPPLRMPAGPRPVSAPPASAMRRRTPWLAVLSFLAMVAIPCAIAAWYLYDLAAERYASRAAFSIRSNESTAPVEIFGAITQLGGGTAAADGQILYDFIQSQQIVRQIADTLDLIAIYGRAPDDLLFALDPDPPIEDLLEHWRRMVDVAVDPSSGILTVEARAFTPEDARKIARAVLDASIVLVNQLSDGARADTVRATRHELREAEKRLRAIRARLRAFRDIEQEVDPTLNAQAALALVAKLEEDRARAQVRLEELAVVLDQEAPQLRSLRRRITTLASRIAEERTRLGTGRPAPDGSTRPLSDIVGDYEELLVDREFAETAYTATLAAHQQAEAEARRRHRHLAVHIEPTLSEEAEYPDRPLWLAAIALLSVAIWSITGLIIGNVRERR